MAWPTLSVIDPSRFRDRVTIKEPPDAETSQDAHGQPAGAWTEVATVWAEVTPGSGAEVFDGDRLLGTVTHTITTRYNADIDRTCRAEFDSRTFLFSSVRNPDGLKRFMEIDAVELV